MRSVSCAIIATVLLCISGCGGPLSSRVAREQIASLQDARISADGVHVERIIAQSGDHAVVEATVQMAFEFAKDSEGEWNIISVRIGEDDWVDMALYRAALAETRISQTQSDLRMLAAGLNAYETENGSLPDVTSADSLSDLLHPLFVPDLVRQDIWGSDFVYEHSGNVFRLRSPGPDLQLDTADDLEVSTADFQ